MSDICIFGGNGKIGIALSCFLKSLGYNVGVSDIMTNNENIYSEHVWINTKPELLPNRYEAFVSCVPSIEISEQIRAEANKRKIKYFDFGGDIEHQDLIRGDFENCQHGVFTGIGLAPGYVNLIASDCVKYLKSKGNIIDEVFMYVGGIPQQRNENILGWLPTWSIEGLLKSYKGTCRILKNGNIINVKPLEYGYSQLPFPIDNIKFNLEIFVNSGGISHSLYEMLDEGIKNCSYFTLRWPGHVNTFKCIEKMAEKFHLTEKQKVDFIKDITATGGKDMVIIEGLIISRKINGDDYTVTFDSSFHANDKFSAMQLATSMPAAAMIDFVIKNNITDYITYKDIDYKEISNIIGILRDRNNISTQYGNTIIDACEESDNGF